MSNKNPQKSFHRSFLQTGRKNTFPLNFNIVRENFFPIKSREPIKLLHMLHPLCKPHRTQHCAHFCVPEFFSHLLFLTTRESPCKLSSIGKPVVFFGIRFKRHRLARNPWQALANPSTWQHKWNGNPTVLTTALRNLPVRTRRCSGTLSACSVKYNERLHPT